MKCGNGAPDMRKAVCATHLPEICRFLGKIHVTMNVRSEDELSVEALQSRVSKASGANYNAGAAVQNTKPVTAPRPSAATGYVRPNAAAEIQASNRDKFWEAHEVTFHFAAFFNFIFFTKLILHCHVECAKNFRIYSRWRKYWLSLASVQHFKYIFWGKVLAKFE